MAAASNTTASQPTRPAVCERVDRCDIVGDFVRPNVGLDRYATHAAQPKPSVSFACRARCKFLLHKNNDRSRYRVSFRLVVPFSQDAFESCEQTSSWPHINFQLKTLGLLPVEQLTWKDPLYSDSFLIISASTGASVNNGLFKGRDDDANVNSERQRTSA